MKIMVLGKDFNVYTLINKLVKEKSVSTLYTNILKKSENEKFEPIDVDERSIESLIKFAKEKRVLYTIILDKDLLLSDVSRKFASENLLVFSPDAESFRICNSQSIIKKLSYKLKILTPKFGVFDKEYQAISAIRDFKFPFFVKSDNGDFCELCYTYSQAKKVIQNLFYHDFKKVIIEQYIEGEYFSFYVVSDGYDVIPFGAAHSFVDQNDMQDVVSIFPYNKIDGELEYHIANDFIFPLIDELNSNENVFLGVLGLDLILAKDRKLYLVGLSNFFKKFDAQSIINAIDMELSQLFFAAAMFYLRDKFENIIFKKEYFSSFELKGDKIPTYNDEIIIEKYKNSKIASVFSSTINSLTEKITDLYEVNNA